MLECSTPLIYRRLRRIFGCKHNYVNTIHGGRVNPTGALHYFKIEDYFCPKCWDTLTDNEYSSMERDKKLKSIGI